MGIRIRWVRRMIWRSITALGLLVLLGMSLPARGENKCPWLNEATASSLLDAPATGAYTGIGQFQPGTCTFSTHGEGGTRTLTIVVEIPLDAHAREGAMKEQCGSDALSIRAIGNEAWICRASEQHGRGSSLVVGRVRNQVFSIELSSTIKKDPMLDWDRLQSRSYLAAEQVSGNLF